MNKVKYKRIYQEEEKDCGAAALSMIISYYGGSYPYEYLKEICHIDIKGTSLYDLSEAAKLTGLNPKAVSGELKDISSDNYPFIAHVKKGNYYHYISVFKKNKETLIIGDPASKQNEISFEEFNEISTGYFLFFRPVNKLKIYKSESYLNNEFIKFVSKNKLEIFYIIIISLLFNFLMMLTAYKSEIFIENVIGFKSSSNLYKLGVYFLSLYLIIYFINYLRLIILDYFINNLFEKIGDGLYDKILKLPYLYHKSKSSSEIMLRIDDLEKIKLFIKNIIILISDLFMMLIGLIFIMSISKLIFYIIILFIILLLLIYLIIIPIINYYLEEIKKERVTYYSFINETLEGFETVQCFNLGTYLKQKHYRILKTKLNNEYRINSFQNILEFIISLLIKVFELIIFILALKLVLVSKLKLNRFITLISIIEFIYKPLFNGFISLISFKDINLSFSRINSLFDAKTIREGGLVIKEKINVEFKNMKYSYTNKLIDNLNLIIDENAKIFISGKSGSGKSTIFKALVKLIEAEGIYLNNFDIKNINTVSLRDNILYLPQDTFIFNDTILNNLCLGKKIDSNEITSALKTTHFDKVLENKNLLIEDIIMQSGFGLSGGEKQKLVLSRALIKKPRILIMDESLSGVSETEAKEILKSIIKEYENMAIVLISHNTKNKTLFKDKFILEKESLCKK